MGVKINGNMLTRFRDGRRNTILSNVNLNKITRITILNIEKKLQKITIREKHVPRMRDELDSERGRIRTNISQRMFNFADSKDQLVRGKIPPRHPD